MFVELQISVHFHLVTIKNAKKYSSLWIFLQALLHGVRAYIINHSYLLRVESCHWINVLLEVICIEIIIVYIIWIYIFRKCFLDADLSISFVGTRATLSVGKSSVTINFDLFEAKAAEKKVELQNILFRLATTATSLEIDLEKANKTIDTLKAQKSQNTGGLMDFGPKMGTNPAKVKPKKTGMSVVNPTSKKRKAATGVVFD